MSELKFVKKSDGSLLPYSTAFVDNERTVVQTVRTPLWSGVGQRISLAEVQAAGLDVKYIPTQTPAYIGYTKVIYMYAAVPEFAERVTELKEMYDFLGISYDAKTEAVDEALVAKFSDVNARTEYYGRLSTALLNVKINFQAANRAYYEYNNPGVGTEEGEVALDPVDDYINWVEFPTLVQWLPGTYTDADIPVKREEEIINTAEREAEIIAEMAADVAE